MSCILGAARKRKSWPWRAPGNDPPGGAKPPPAVVLHDALLHENVELFSAMIPKREKSQNVVDGRNGRQKVLVIQSCTQNCLVISACTLLRCSGAVPRRTKSPLTTNHEHCPRQPGTHQKSFRQIYSPQQCTSSILRSVWCPRF